MNMVILKGRLVKDPELKAVGAKNKALCEFTLAVPDKWEPKNKGKAYYPNCIAWEKLAEIISQYCVKGQEVLITGRNSTQKWEKNGQKFSRDRVICDTVEFCGKKPEGAGGGQDDSEPPW